ncbi:uncharacterized protein [Oscarella lobularis]|uniref:uncharacterized protein n=1 Tax=Oscarella lobularis TaxID=121494 RepID=UPI00331368DE
MASARGDDSQSYAYVKNLNVDSLCCTICLAVRSFVLQELRQIVAEANSHLSRRPLSNAKNQLQRVVALKKMINALEIYCPKRHDGCKAIVKQDALESHLLQCDYSKVPCPTCGQSTKREVIEGHLHKQAKEISQREAEREEAKEKIIELEDSLASMKSELDDAIEVFDFSYSYGTNRRGCPGNVNTLKLFSCIHRSFVCWKSVDTLMLAATAYATRWFTVDQNMTLLDWMESLLEAEAKQESKIYVIK